MVIKAVLFDLDGTLLDTAADLGMALNQLLQEHSLPILPLDAIRPAAGSGCRGLLKLGMNITPDASNYPALATKLLNFYQEHLTNTTRLFPGMDETLDFIESKQLPWGIVTNKPAQFTDPLIAHLRLNQRAKCVISGDTLPNHKPHPEPILHACRLVQQSPEHCLYIGDSAIDVQASKAAGSPSLVALYGYIPEFDDPFTWGANGYIRHPSEIVEHLIF